ncbi:hypothetical protein ACM66B_005822 [Microbotryomycetes sp. NB124-2]
MSSTGARVMRTPPRSPVKARSTCRRLDLTRPSQRTQPVSSREVALSSSSQASNALRQSQLSSWLVPLSSSQPRSSPLALRPEVRFRPSPSDLTCNKRLLSSSSASRASGKAAAPNLDDLDEAIIIEHLRSHESTPTQKSADSSSEDVIFVDESDSSVEVVHITKPTLTDATNASTQTINSSGWFSKPDWVKDKEQKQPAASERTRRTPMSRRAKASAKEERDRWMREQYNHDFDWRTFAPQKPRFVYTSDEQVVDREVANLVRLASRSPEIAAEHAVLGFDLEWDPSTRRGIENRTAVLQLCSVDTILIVHLSKMRRFPESVKRLMEDRNVIKCGVQIGGDSSKLRRDFDVKPQGLLELSTLAKAANPEYKERPGLIGLQALVGSTLQRYLPKGDVRTSLWSRSLSSDQKQYAADDVYSSLQTFRALFELLGPGAKLARFVSHDPASVSLWRLPQESRASTASQPTSGEPATAHSAAVRTVPKARELEAYELWHKQALTVSETAERMKIKPISVVWNLLGLMSTLQGAQLQLDSSRLVQALDEVKALEHDRLMLEHGELIKSLRAKVT